MRGEVGLFRGVEVAFGGVPSWRVPGSPERALLTSFAARGVLLMTARLSAFHERVSFEFERPQWPCAVMIRIYPTH